jgi:hypothetical protein
MSAMRLTDLPLYRASLDSGVRTLPVSADSYFPSQAKPSVVTLKLKTEHLQKRNFRNPERAPFVPPNFPAEVDVSDVLSRDWMTELAHVFCESDFESHIQTFWDQNPNSYESAFWLAAHYFVIKGASKEGYVVLVEQAGLLV